jgi:hypothetical protein
MAKLRFNRLAHLQEKTDECLLSVMNLNPECQALPNPVNVNDILEMANKIGLKYEDVVNMQDVTMLVEIN